MNDALPVTTTPLLACGLDRPLPAELHVGHGSVLHMQGWCYAPGSEIARLELVAGDTTSLVPGHSYARPDIFTLEYPERDETGQSLLSGFVGFLPLSLASGMRDVDVSLRAHLADGRRAEKRLGQIRIYAGLDQMPIAAQWPTSGPKVAICMAMYNPPAALLEAQISSIRAQTHQNWVCIVNDDGTPNEDYDRIRYDLKSDPRFFVFQNAERQNFYRNFETCLRRAPLDVDFIALCDQDDVWDADKLSSLIGAFQTPETLLVYSDARIVDSTGRVRSKTFWVNRRNNYTDLPTLMVANTITGAASMIRAALLQDILPFPEPVGPAFHDHWLGLVALYKGRIGYVNRPLYDYIQHADGVIGHNYNPWSGFTAAFKEVFRHAPRRGQMARAATGVLQKAAFDHVFVQQKVMLARTLMLRVPDAAQQKRAVMQRFARFEGSWLAALREKLAASLARRPTLNLEGMFLWSILGTKLRNLAFRLKRAEIARLQKERPGARLLDAVIAEPTAITALPASAEPEIKRVPVLEFGNTRPISHNISGLTLDISEDHPKRVNLLLAMIDFKYVFGGYLGMFNLALRLAREGYPTRIILHERTEWDMAEWRRQIRKYPGITSLFDEVEVIARFDRSVPVPVNPRDRFIATNCWAAHIANNTVQTLEETRFLFMIQEYEPYFLPMNSISALFRQAYSFPQLALFSTELLSDFFRQERIGVFAEAAGEADAMVFSNAIQKFQPKRESLMRQERRLLVYARPEEHAARNLFELGMIALARLARDPRVDLSKWSFHGIGSIDRSYSLELAPGIPLQLLPKTSLQEYIDMMPRFDVGLSLMLTPHPSLVPLEMASAGMWAVTNTFANKTAEALRRISTNLIGVEPTVDAIVDGLVNAMTRVDDVEARLAGAQMSWPTDWSDAFPPESIHKIRAFLGATKA
jgi:glycosyltransferase involved in cell wall biosynthesis